MPLAYGIGGLISVPQGAVQGFGPPAASFKGDLGQSYFDKSTTPFTEYVYNGSTWTTAGANPATTTTYGTVLLTDNSQPVATKVYADNLVIAGAPVATETTAGIGQLATDAEAIAGTPSTGLLALFVTPSNLAPFLAATALPASFTDLTATGAVSFTGATGAIVMTSATASSFGTTGAGIDLTLDSAAGRVIVNGEEAAANAITLLSAAGGIDVDAALQINIASSQNAADAIRIVASAGGIDVDAVGAAGEDINITNTGGSVVIVATESAADSIVISSSNGGIDITAAGAAAGEDIDITATGSSINITATENNAGAIIVRANGGTSERVTLLASQGTGADSINLESTAGGITLSAALATADAINLAASAGGVDIDGALQVNIASSQNAVDAIRIVASAGGIDIDAVGAATEDINITNTGGSIVIVATESVADAIRMNASGAAGGFDIDAGSNGFIVDTSTGAISLDSGLASNFTVTGAADLSLISSLGSVNITAGEDAADAIVLSAGAGGIDILATGAAGQDIDIVNTGGSVNVTATEDVAEAIYIRANGGTSETIRVHADQGTGVASINIGSDVGGVTIAGGLGTADAVNITASTAGGGIDIDSSTGGFDVLTTGAISLDSALASNFTVTGSADLTLSSSAGAVNVTSGEANADSINVTSAGGMNVVATGAAAKDTIITNTNGSMTLTAGENVTDAMNFTASGAASRITLTAGTGSISLASGLVVKKKDVVFADSPYTVLGTDYFLSVDTSGGAITVTLPNAATLAGRTYVIRDTGGAAAATNITVATAGGNLVGGGASAATKTISAAYAGATVYSNGTTWNYCYVA